MDNLQLVRVIDVAIATIIENTITIDEGDWPFGQTRTIDNRAIHNRSISSQLLDLVGKRFYLEEFWEWYVPFQRGCHNRRRSWNGFSRHIMAQTSQ